MSWLKKKFIAIIFNNPVMIAFNQDLKAKRFWNPHHFRYQSKIISRS